MRKNFIYIFIAACFLAGCTGKSALRVDEGYGEPVAAAEPFTPVPSIIYLPAEIKTDYIEKAVNEQLSGTLYQSDTITLGGISNVRVTVRKNGRIKIRAQDDELLYSVPLKISMRFSFTISVLGLSHTEYQDADAGISIALRSKIALKNNWRLVTKTKADGYAWTSDPVVKVRSFSIPVKPAADYLMARQVDIIGRLVDKSVSGSVNVKEFVEPLWQQIRTPIEIPAADLPHKIWLRLNPAEIYMTQLSGQGGSISGTAGIRAVTEAFIGDKPEPLPEAELPDFEPPPETDSTFVINLYSEIPFENATLMSREMFAGKTLKSGRQSVTVRDIEIAGTKNGLAEVRLDLTGSINGKVCVTGKAVYNEKTQMLTIENMDFDIQTQSNFQKARNWLLKGIIVSKIKPHLKFPLKDAFDEAKVLADNMLAGYKLYEGVSLNGRLDSLSIGGVELTETGFRVVIVVKGFVSVGVK